MEIVIVRDDSHVYYCVVLSHRNWLASHHQLSITKIVSTVVNILHLYPKKFSPNCHKHPICSLM